MSTPEQLIADEKADQTRFDLMLAGYWECFGCGSLQTPETEVVRIGMAEEHDYCPACLEDAGLVKFTDVKKAIGAGL